MLGRYIKSGFQSETYIEGFGFETTGHSIDSEPIPTCCVFLENIMTLPKRLTKLGVTSALAVAVLLGIPAKGNSLTWKATETFLTPSVNARNTDAAKTQTKSSHVDVQWVAQNKCRTLPNQVLASLANRELQKLRPFIHLNQVNFEAMKSRSKNIYQLNDNWARLGNETFSLGNFEPYYRPRRSHYLMDFNSQSVKILPSSEGIRLRIEFETEGTEIKGWCHKCKLKKRRDRAAADANILPRTGRFPFVDMTIDLGYANGKLQIDLRDIHADLRIDGRGFLELFEKHIERKVKQAIEKGIRNNWDDMSPMLETRVAKVLSEGAGSFIRDVRFHNNQVTVCTK